MTERIPKHANGLQTVGVRVVNETLESLAVTDHALHAPNDASRLAYIDVLIHSMTIVKSACREMYDYSRKDRSEVMLGADGMPVTNDQGQAKVVKSPRYGRVISHTQYVSLLGLFAELGKEVGKWQRTTMLRMSQGYVRNQ